MNKNARSLLIIVIAALVSAVLLSQNPLHVKADRTVITWFVGLGTGTNEPQINKQNEIVERFNASQSDIELKIHFASHGQSPPSSLGTLIASGNAPGIVGPVGFRGAHVFAGQWLDLVPLIKKYNYDLTQFPKNLVELYREDGKLVGIPFAVFPGIIFYNADLFDKAKLAYPPAKFGQKYTLDGKEVEWDWDTVAEIAKRMTLDAAGNNPTNADFMPDKIEQFGFVHQWSSIRSDFSTFGGAPVVNEQGRVEIPEHWREAAKWLHNGIWKDHFIPNENYIYGELLNKPLDQYLYNPFASDKIAMARSMLWYTCCLEDITSRWDFAVMPSYKGTVYAPADADTFRIHKDTENPDAAFKVLQYILGDAAPELVTVYGTYPARPDLQDDLIKIFQDKHPNVKNWHVVAPSVEYAVVPSHEALMPNYREVQDRFYNFNCLLYSDTGKDIDLDVELDKLEVDLQIIVDKEQSTYNAIGMSC